MEVDEAEDEELQCPVCLLMFQEPRELSCKHSFCTSCLRAIIASQSAKRLHACCPLCRNPILEKSVEALPINAALQSRVSKFARPPEPSAPPMQAHQEAGADSSFTKRKQPGFFDKLFSSRHVKPLSEGEKENGMCFGCKFEVTEDELLALARDWLKGCWLLPSDLDPASIKLGPITAVYLPFFSFDTRTRTHYSGSVVVRKGEKGPTRTISLPGGYLESEYHHLVLASVDPDPVLRELTEEIHIDAGHFTVMPSLCEPEVIAAAANVFQNHVEKSVQSSDETKALSALRSRCGIGATVVSARINDISTDTYWNESLVCVPFYRSSFTYDGRQFELLVHGVTGACVGTRPYGSGILGVAAKKVMEGVRAFGEWLGVVDPPVQQNGGNNNNNNNNE